MHLHLKYQKIETFRAKERLRAKPQLSKNLNTIITNYLLVTE